MLENYFKIILRNIRRHPLHTMLNLSCLTIGIAGTLLILLYLHFELTYDSYHSKASRIYRITTNAIKTHQKTIDVTWNSTPAPLGPVIQRDIAGVEAHTRLFQFWVSEDVQFAYNESVLKENDVYAADPSVFDVFSFDFVSGNPKNALDGPDKIVLSESLANRIFGDEDPMGKIIKSTMVHEQPGLDAQFPLVVTGRQLSGFFAGLHRARKSYERQNHPEGAPAKNPCFDSACRCDFCSHQHRYDLSAIAVFTEERPRV
jgi:putative ABC transport system permease protein